MIRPLAAIEPPTANSVAWVAMPIISVPGAYSELAAARVDLGIEVFADDRSVVDEVAGPAVVAAMTNAGERLLQVREQIGDRSRTRR